MWTDYLPYAYLLALYFLCRNLPNGGRCITDKLVVLWVANFFVWAWGIEPIGYIFTDFTCAMWILSRHKSGASAAVALCFIPMIVLNAVQGMSGVLDPKWGWWLSLQLLSFFQLFVAWAGGSFERVADYLNVRYRRPVLFAYLDEGISKIKGIFRKKTEAR